MGNAWGIRKSRETEWIGGHLGLGRKERSKTASRL